MTIKILTAGDLLQKGMSGEEITKEEVLAIYADPHNWEILYVDGKPRWIWKGPVICAFEAARWVLKEKS